MRRFFLSICAPMLFALFVFSSCDGQGTRYKQAAEQQASLPMREVRMELEDYKRQIYTQKQELALLDEKVEKQLKLFQEFQQQWLAVHSQEQDAKKNEEKRSLEKVKRLDHSLKKVIGDLKQFANFTKQSQSTVKQQEKRLKSLENREKHLDEKLTHVKKAVESLVSMMKAPSKGSAKKYSVKEGDYLERIARKHKTTVETIKKMNHLDSDLIVIGQELSIP